MEIVRQRRKRLLAWILTLVLCVGMWQGSVQAEGEDGGDGALTSPEVMSTEGVDESEDHETEEGMNLSTTLATNVRVEINMRYDMDGKMNHPGIPNAVVCDNWKEKNGSAWSIDSDGNMFYSAGYTGDMLDITDVSLKNGEHEHKVLNWRYEVLEDGKNQQKEQTTGQVDLSNMVLTQNETSEKYDLTAVLGKSIVVTFWEQAGSAGESNYQQYEQIVTDCEDKLDNSESSQWIIETPAPKIKNNEMGYFVSGWYVGGDELIQPGNRAMGGFDEFEKEITALPSYSNEIQGVGEYSLVVGCDYFYAKDQFIISKDGTEEGYTYTIGADTGFYVRENGNYTFK